MLLLSSATRILATELPPLHPHTMARPPGLEAASLDYWSIGDRTRQRKVPVRVSEGNTVLLAIDTTVFIRKVFAYLSFRHFNAIELRVQLGRFRPN
jgi:hypothetical protein